MKDPGIDQSLLIAKFYASHFRWVVPRTNMTGLAIAKFYASRLR